MLLYSSLSMNFETIIQNFLKNQGTWSIFLDYLFS